MISKGNEVPKLKGLILAGGKSSRMGHNKEQIAWHGKEQKYYAADLLSQFCSEVYISCRQDQLQHIAEGYKGLSDNFIGMGPTGGILTALRSDREVAWLVIACDLPLVDEPILKNLVENRNPEKIATTYKSPFDGLPEPLITIWEPDSYPILLEYLGKGKTCPRKVLINTDCLILEPEQPQKLMNVNTPQDLEEAKKYLSKKML
jgi:molybdopterin-guanine dinucleotide biosynthesis protein A